MIEDCVILGGGVAGLSAANQLADAGLSPLLIEANDYPAHRVCGEFLSPECLPILEKWESPISAYIENCRFHSHSNSSGFKLPNHAGSCSRFTFDSFLHRRAQKKGARILTNTRVSFFNPGKDYYELTLANGQTIKARSLMLGTGRVPKLNEEKQPPILKYVGFKAHFSGITNNASLDMHCFNGGYLGISPVDAHTANIACLVKKEIAQIKSITALLKKIEPNAKMLFPEWLTGQLPEFGIRENPSWERVFWIGDAAGSIPPICGDGLAIGITSGCMAADYLLNSNAEAFKKAWLKRYQSRFFWALRLHSFMLSKRSSRLAIGACNFAPFLAPFVWKLTRE